MKLLLAICLVTSMSFAIPLPTSGYDEIYKSINGGEFTAENNAAGQRRAKLFVRDIKNMPRLAQKWDIAIGGILKIAYHNLNQFEFPDAAQEIQSDWRQHKGELIRIVNAIQYDERAQQDLDGYWKWLDETYLKIEGKLGYELCHSLRLDDLYSLNRIGWIFRPCSIGESQWTCVLCGDKHVPIPAVNPRRGDLPIISYWATSVSCGVATFGVGVIGMVCGPLAMVVEYTVDSWACPRLETWLYTKACGRN